MNAIKLFLQAFKLNFGAFFAANKVWITIVLFGAIFIGGVLYIGSDGIKNFFGLDTVDSLRKDLTQMKINTNTLEKNLKDTKTTLDTMKESDSVEKQSKETLERKMRLLNNKINGIISNKDVIIKDPTIYGSEYEYSKAQIDALWAVYCINNNDTNCNTSGK